jgi:uncharacterized protein (DUF983 family)
MGAMMGTAFRVGRLDYDATLDRVDGLCPGVREAGKLFDEFLRPHGLMPQCDEDER